MPELTVDDFNKRIGAIIMNLQSLESIIRFFFFRENGEQHPFPKQCGNSYVPSTSLTNYCQLRKWVRKFNSGLKQEEFKRYSISEEVVDIRDAIAHGRLIAPDPPSLPYTLWQFGEPIIDGQVEVKLCAALTAEWLDGKWKLISAEKDKVVACFKARGFQGLS
jgi:hypothetical protein